MPALTAIFAALRCASRLNARFEWARKGGWGIDFCTGLLCS
jgi:hypothetical protein